MQLFFPITFSSMLVVEFLSEVLERRFDTVYQIIFHIITTWYDHLMNLFGVLEHGRQLKKHRAPNQ